MSNSDWYPKFGPMPNMVMMYGTAPLPGDDTDDFAPRFPQWPPQDTTAEPGTLPTLMTPAVSPATLKAMGEITVILGALTRGEQLLVLAALKLLISEANP